MIDELLELSPHWGLDTLLLLVVLLALEAILSADNAIALAALVQGIENPQQQRRALNLGLVISYVLRIGLIFTATWVLKFWQFELAGALYLLWLSIKYFFFTKEPEHEHQRVIRSFWQAVPLLALADLAFSLDSVTTAIALADERWLVVLGGTIGVIMLRFMAELFIRWLQEFPRLEDAGYLTVTLVGLRLLIRVVNPVFVPPDGLMIGLIALCFLWGFSKRRVEEPVTPPVTPSTKAPEPTSRTPKK